MKTTKDINYSFGHVNDRLKERFDLSISWKEYKDLNEELKNDKSNVILVENQDQEIHQFRFKGKLVTFDYSISKGYITTAMKWV